VTEKKRRGEKKSSSEYKNHIARGGRRERKSYDGKSNHPGKTTNYLKRLRRKRCRRSASEKEIKKEKFRSISKKKTLPRGDGCMRKGDEM